MTDKQPPKFETFDELQAWAGEYARRYALRPAVDQLEALNHIRAVTLDHSHLMAAHR